MSLSSVSLILFSSHFAKSLITISPLIKLYSFLINKENINCSVNLDSIREKIKSNSIDHYEPILRSEFAILGQPAKSLDFEVPLIKLAYARSGDKGNHVNIGVISRKSDYFPFIKDSLNIDIIAKQLKNISKESILCWELPKIYGLNFLLKNCLDGGGMSSLLLDPQGKGYAQNFLNIKISVPESVYNEVICV